MTVHDVIRRTTVRLWSNVCRAIGLQRDIASQHQRYRLVDAAVARWERRLGLLGNVGYSLTPRLTGWGLWQRFAI